MISLLFLLTKVRTFFYLSTSRLLDSAILNYPRRKKKTIITRKEFMIAFHLCFLFAVFRLFFKRLGNKLIRSGK